MDDVAALLALAMARMVEARDGPTHDHSLRIARLAAGLAERMGLTARRQRVVRLGGLLHDVGKVAVPDTILRKPAPLDEAEWAIMSRHPQAGARILRGIPALADVVEVVRHHHERWDGTGYPHGLAGEAIPLEARIVAVADAYAAMTEDRPYRRGLSPLQAVAEIRAQAGRQFDPAVVASFPFSGR